MSSPILLEAWVLFPEDTEHSCVVMEHTPQQFLTQSSQDPMQASTLLLSHGQ